MSELHLVSGHGHDDWRADVVFVHGLDGDARSTWHPKGKPESFWPDWIAAEFPRIGIWTFGYEASASAWTGQGMPLIDRATDTLDAFELEGLGSRPLGFVCHSLGGLVIKQLLRTASQRRRVLAARTKFVLFLSTPHSGSDLAGWIKYLDIILRPTVSARELEAHRPYLRDLNHWYRDEVNGLGIDTFVYFEKRKTRGILVVNETSADPGIPGVRPVPLDEDHKSICKPASRKARVHKRVVQLIKDKLDIEPVDAADYLEDVKLDNFFLLVNLPQVVQKPHGKQPTRCGPSRNSVREWMRNR